MGQLNSHNVQESEGMMVVVQFETLHAGDRHEKC